jgi:hypothetical protein
MEHTKKFEDFTSLDFSDLGHNWSADYHVNKKNDKRPYIKKGNIFIEVINSRKKSIPKNAIYLTTIQADKLNKIGDELNRLKELQEEILNQQKKILGESLITESTMNIIDISKIISRMGMDEDIILEWLQQVFRRNGDQGVIDVYKGFTGIEIEALSKGRYVFKH